MVKLFFFKFIFTENGKLIIVSTAQRETPVITQQKQLRAKEKTNYLKGVFKLEQRPRCCAIQNGPVLLSPVPHSQVAGCFASHMDRCLK